MEMDEDMEIETTVFEVREIDLEYEFDAARWFDFTREELLDESQAAEFWFHSAPSYEPSPFVTNVLLGEEVYEDKTEASTGSEDEDVAADVCDKDRDKFQQPNHLATYLNRTGPIVSNQKHTDKPKFRSKSSVRPTPRSSTLMRPTASQLAKQNNTSKFHTQLDQIHNKGNCGTSGTEVQASKRQKLDGGLLRKFADTKQEMSFVHKIPKKDTTLDKNIKHTRAKITTPREPDFATSQRAFRTRHKNDAKLEQDSTTVYRFKARPFNRKIFEAPTLPTRKKSTPKLPEFQEFHLKTSERAMQHSSAVTTRSRKGNDAYKGSDKSNISDVLESTSRESKRPTTMDRPKHNVSEGNYVFKARPLNKKILSSRGDMGVFKNSKRETTVPLEFSFHSEKRGRPDLPTDLFSKLSIKSEQQPNDGSRTRLFQPKVSKENRMNSFQARNELTRTAVGKPVSSAGQQIQWTATRSLGIR